MDDIVAVEQLFGQCAGFAGFCQVFFFFSPLFKVVLHDREHVPLTRAWAQNSLARGTEAAIQSDRAHCCVLVTCRIFILLAKMLGWSSMQDRPLHIWWHFFNCVLSEMKEEMNRNGKDIFQLDHLVLQTDDWNVAHTHKSLLSTIQSSFNLIWVCFCGVPLFKRPRKRYGHENIFS